MAVPRDKLPENAGGKYYVDVQCIDCDVCRVTAPGNFRRDDIKAYSYVFRQPSTPDEEAQCQEAKELGLKVKKEVCAYYNYRGQLVQ